MLLLNLGIAQSFDTREASSGRPTSGSAPSWLHPWIQEHTAGSFGKISILRFLSAPPGLPELQMSCPETSKTAVFDRIWTVYEFRYKAILP